MIERYEELVKAGRLIADAGSKVWRENGFRPTPVWSMLLRVHRYVERQAEDALYQIVKGDA